MNRVFFVADFFCDEVLGGGELNNEEVIKELALRNLEIHKIKSDQLTPEKIKEYGKEAFYIIGNFVSLSKSCRELITNENSYIIYEHDHKYLIHRNPAYYKDFKAPSNHIINYDFYKNAKAVLCQSKFHLDIIAKNMELTNIVNLGGNLWSTEILEKIKEISNRPKNDKCSIMFSSIPHKNTEGAVRYCKENSLNYELIPSLPYLEFLRETGKNKKLVFLPKTPETLSRVIVECRMMGMSVVSNNLVGATRENWFSLKGEKLIDRMLLKRKEIIDKIVEVIND